MKLIGAVFSELLHLFVDDGALALFSALLIAAVTGTVKLLAMPPLGGALALLVGAIAILAESVRRAARRRR